MIPALRKSYNAAFTKEKYDAFLKELDNAFPGQIEFRVAETPIFVPKGFTQKMLDACESIIDVIIDPRFMTLTANAIPPNLQVLGENDYPDFESTFRFRPILKHISAAMTENPIYRP
jgi:hypothetical protein